MKNYNVVFEIQVGAETPLDAAKKVQEWLQNPNDNWQYYVQDEETKNIFSVDLDDDDCAYIINNYQPLIEKGE